MDFCTQKNISGVQMVLKFEEQAYELVMPVVASREGYLEIQDLKHAARQIVGAFGRVERGRLAHGVSQRNVTG